MRGMGRSAVMAVALYAGWVGAVLGGTVTETASRELPDGKESNFTTLQVEGGKLRMEQKDAAGKAGDSGLLFRDQKIYGLNHKKKTYTVIDQAAAKAIAAKLNETFAQMEEQLERMPPEQRAMVEQAMGRSGGEKRPPTTFEKTARNEKAGSRTCRIWEGTRAYDKIIEYCVVPHASVTGSAEILATMKQMMALMADITAAISDSGMGASPLTTEWEGVEKIDGYPVLTRVFEDGQAATETVLKSARSEAIPAEQFEIPPGYTQEKMTGL